MTIPKTLKIDDTVYVREDMVLPKTSKRAVIVVDRGWIVAGDVTEENGRIKLTRALHVFGWAEVGFAGMVQNPKVNTDLRSMPDGFDIPAGSEIFRVYVDENWGL